MSETQNPTFGNVIRQMYQGDRVILSIDGREIGYVELLRVPRDQKVKVAFAFSQSVRITRSKEDAPDA